MNDRTSLVGSEGPEAVFSLERKVARALEAGLWAANLPPDSRIAMQWAVGCAMETLAASGLPDGAVLALRQLFYALADLDRGIVHPALAPVRGSGRTPIATSEMQARACLAAALEVGIRNGMKREPAAKDIAQKIIIDPTQPNLTIADAAKRLISWRDQFVNGKEKGTYQAGPWESMLELLDTNNGWLPPPNEMIDRLIAMAFAKRGAKR